ncbi:Glycosyltransferase involved in cell wall bisynthesis [Cryptosporangium aurantiacum]|uniref:Glycosyltransferase involved in cell wall bisynthesis n=1 Tax=Cryptosporangium aurantiacum TaxID=134849 RepID=A0A1M7IEA6_9ACTN|nr:glycosyltransferase family 4 protein [Cryptosporangium aurantiacum]SHM39091.1 Glycosyltransferase involved in cell wall bisynthesis [Cryptosporangium aurantiacum]
METAALPAVLIFNWRDLRNPEGGGSELYAEQVAAALARRGHPVTILCAAHEYGDPEETTPDGVRIVRRGGRHTVYARAAWEYLRGRLGRPGVVVDVQNGLPFLSRLYARTPVVLLVHHVHREQWRVVLGPVAARFGWWVESWLSPRVHRSCRYVAVSESTRAELTELGVDPERITIIHNGTPPPDPRPRTRATSPTLLVLGRLVPHKRVEVALRAVQRLSADHPDIRLVVAGQGWWLEPLREEAARLGISDRVRFAGFVDEDEKQRLLAESWAMLVPSLKEGWGLSVIEAAAHGTPAVAFRNAGGVAESVVDGETGFLADDEDEFIGHCARIVRDDRLRTSMGEAARAHAGRFTWDETGKRFAALVDDITG